MTACTFRPQAANPDLFVVRHPATPTATLLPTGTATATLSPTPTPTPMATRRTLTSTPTGKVVSPTATATTASTQQPESLSTPSAEKLGVPGVSVSETMITLPTYPFRDYLVEQVDPVYNMPVFYFNRPDYEAAMPTPVPVDYTGVILENPYLRLTFLPELGGRLYSAVVKATGQEIFYQNPVVKPSRYGGLQPPEANWWLATGGMEWAYPIQEHGHRFGVAWDYQVSQDDTGATITLSDVASDRVSLRVEVTLPADKAQFVVKPILMNNGTAPVPVQLWLNAALTLGSGSMSSRTQFVIPAEQVTVHSRGPVGWTLPEERQALSWPQVGQIDLRDYNQWGDYLGLFVSNQEATFIGAYNPVTDLGVVRLARSGPASGSGKLFAFGREFPDRSYTDDDSQYFEIWGGANAGFWPEDDIVLPAGETLSWEEVWWPLAGLAGLTWSTEEITIYLEKQEGEYHVSALVSAPLEGQLTIRREDQSLLDQPFLAIPGIPLEWTFSAAEGPLTIQFLDHRGQILLDYQPN